MKLIWHLARKDLRQHRWPLLVLATLHLLHLAGGVALLQLGPWATESGWDYRVVLYAQIALALTWLVSVLLVPGIVHGDALFSDRAFWMTRPIGWARLLRAKLLTLTLIFVGLPLVLRLPWWLANGAGFAEVAGNIVALFLVGGAFLGVTWAIAAPTRHSYAYLILLFAAMVVLPTMYSLLITDLRQLESRGIAPWVADGLAVTRLGLAAAVLLAVGIGLIATQYRRRGQVLGYGWAVGGLAVLLLIAKFWYWDLVSPVTARESDADSDPALSRQVRLDYDGAGYFAGRQAEIDFHLMAAPQGYSVFLTGQHVWSWPDGTRETVDEAGGLVVNADLGALLGLPAMDFASIRSEELRRLVRSPWWGDPRGLDAPIDPSDPDDTGIRAGGRFMLVPRTPTLEQFQREKPAYALTAVLKLMKPRLAGTAPLQAGAVIDHGNSRLALLGVTEKGDSLILDVLEHAPASTLIGSLRGLFTIVPSRAPLTFQIWLVNRSTHTARSLPLELTEWQIADVIIRRGTIWTTSELVRSKSEARPAAVSKIEFARIDWDTEATFVRTVRAESFDPGPMPDVIRFDPRKGQGIVTGEVNRPGASQLVIHHASVLTPLRAGLGFTAQADTSRIQLVRTAPDGRRSTQRLDVEAYLRGELREESFPLLQDGDVIDVPRK